MLCYNCSIPTGQHQAIHATTILVHLRVSSTATLAQPQQICSHLIQFIHFQPVQQSPSKSLNQYANNPKETKLVHISKIDTNCKGKGRDRSKSKKFAISFNLA
ncbi:unnamed protein product [Lathyrus oleraceus]